MPKSLSFFAYASLLTVIIITVMLNFFSFEPEYDIIRLESSWTVQYRGEQYINTDLEKLSSQIGGSFSKGDVITLNHIGYIEDIGAPFPYLFFKTQFCAYEIFLDGELIASRYMDSQKDNSFVGIGYNPVALPIDYTGKKLSIKLYVTENNTKADIYSPVVGNYDDLYREFFHSALYAFLTGIFLIVFGEVFLIISLIFAVRSSGAGSQIVSSLLCMVLGSWIIPAYDFSDFIIPAGISTAIEYMSLYMLVPCMYLLVYVLHRRFDNRLLLLMGSATSLFSVTYALLHMLNIVHISHFQLPYFGLSFIGIIILLTYSFIDVKYKNTLTSNKSIMVGVFLLTMCLLFYAGIAIGRRTVDYRQNIFLNILLPTGGLLFVIMELLNYFVFMTHSFAQKREYAKLTRIAYLDSLTKLPNRVSCDEKLAEASRSKDNFCIVSLDLNGLKEVNDNSGHPAGDRLLRSFAHALAETFDDYGSSYRIGGDEFLVLISNIEQDTIDSLLKDLNEKLKKLDEEDPEINHSVSYGYAYRDETDDGNTHSVYMLADSRMYELKRRFYNAVRL